MKYYNKSLQIFKETLTSNYQSISTAIYNIGQVHYNQSLKIDKETLAPNHLSIVIHNIGKVYNNLGKYERSIFLFRKIWKSFEILKWITCKIDD